MRTIKFRCWNKVGNKGLVVYDDSLGLLIVDGILDDGRVLCDNGHVITYVRYLEKVDQEMLDDRHVTQVDLDKYNAHI